MSRDRKVPFGQQKPGYPNSRAQSVSHLAPSSS